MAKRSAAATIGGGCLLMILSCGVCGIFGALFDTESNPAATRARTQPPPRQLASALDVTNTERVDGDASDEDTLIEQRLKNEVADYESAVASYEQSVEQIESAKRGLAETEAAIALHDEAKPMPITHVARKWKTLIGDHETTAKYVASDAKFVKLLKQNETESVAVPIEKLVAENRIFIQNTVKQIQDYEDTSGKWLAKQSELADRKRSHEASLGLASGQPPKRPARDEVASKVRAERIAAAKVKAAREEAIKRQARERENAKLAESAAASAKRDREAFDAFMAVVNFDDTTKMLISSARQDGDTIIVEVKNLWHVRAYQMRLQDAQTLWEIWARLKQPKAPDKARLKLVDGRDNEVGGSRVWGGSLIWVQER